MMKNARAAALVAAPLLALLAATPALAHVGGHGAFGAVGGFASGFSHPFLGADHVAAMVAVGLWGALLGGRAVWMLPVAFPLMMALGGAMGAAGMGLPAVELGIAASAIVIGLAVAFAAPAPLWITLVVVGVFAIFHGHAHGTEMPLAVDPMAYAVGFVIGTGILHLIGIGIGLAAKWPSGRLAVRAGGGAIALAGVAFLTGAA